LRPDLLNLFMWHVCMFVVFSD